MAVFSLMDGVSKELTGRYDPVEVFWGRYLFHTLFLLPVLARGGGRDLLASPLPLLQLARGVLLLASGLLFITALSRLPLADATAVGFVAPVLVTALSIPLLGEQVGRARWLAVLTGFAGVLAVVRPAGAGFEPAALLPVCSATCWAGSLILTRRLAAVDSPLTTLLYTAVAGLALSSLMVPWLWHGPDAAGWLALAVLGALSAFAQYLLLRAFVLAGASVLAPFQYSQIVWSTAIGYLWFGTLPDGWTWAGAAVIMLSGLYLWQSERRPGSRR